MRCWRLPRPTAQDGRFDGALHPSVPVHMVVVDWCFLDSRSALGLKPSVIDGHMDGKSEMSLKLSF